MKIKSDDTVLIIAGKDKGKKGKVVNVLPKEGKIIVEGVNIKKKSMRAKKSGEKGQIVEIVAPFNVSNAKLLCPKCKKPVRIGYKVTEGGKYRVCKKCKQELN